MRINEFIAMVKGFDGVKGVEIKSLGVCNPALSDADPHVRIVLSKNGYSKEYKVPSPDSLFWTPAYLETVVVKDYVHTIVRKFLSGLAPEKNEETHRARVLAVDFDGCLCENRWPSIGPANRAVIDALKARKANGWKLILWTCRESELLEDALKWCAEEGVTFDAVNDNLPETVKEYGTNPRKVSADEYWDDHAVRKCYGENV